MTKTSPEREAYHRVRLTRLANEARLASEQLAIAVAECIGEGISSRRIAPWLDVAHATVNRMGVRGRAARDRRGDQAAEQRGERGEVGGGAGD